VKVTNEIQKQMAVRKGVNNKNSPIPQDGEWTHVTQIKDLSGLTHGVGGCAPQQGVTKLTLNIKKGIIEEALIETIGCSGMTHSAAIAAEVIVGKTVLEALNTDLVCDAINVAMRELFLQIAYGRSQTAFSKDGLPIGAGLEDLGKYLSSQKGTVFSTTKKGVRYLHTTEGYITKQALDKNNEVIGYEFVNVAQMMELITSGLTPNEAYEKSKGTYGRFSEAEKIINPRHK